MIYRHCFIVCEVEVIKLVVRKSREEAYAFYEAKLAFEDFKIDDCLVMNGNGQTRHSRAGEGQSHDDSA